MGFFLAVLRDRVVVVLVNCVYDVLQHRRALPFCMFFPLVSADGRRRCLVPAGRVLLTVIYGILAPESGTFEFSISTSALLLSVLRVPLVRKRTPNELSLLQGSELILHFGQFFLQQENLVPLATH